MANDSEVLAYISERVDRPMQKLITDFYDFIDYCIEWEMAYPTKSDFDKWLSGDRKSIFKHD